MRGMRHRIRIEPSVFLLIAGVAALLITQRGRDVLPSLLLLLLSSGIHEVGHVVMAQAVGVRLRVLRLELLGARLETDGMMSYGQEWWLCMGGPLFNLISAGLLLPILAALEDTAARVWLGEFVALSIGLGGLNLLPIETFDGGRMLYCMFVLFLREDVAGRIARWVSFSCLSVLWMFSAYVLLRVGRSLSMLVFSTMLLYRGLLGAKDV